METTKSDLNFKKSTIIRFLKSRYFLFVGAFLCLIVASHSYNTNLKRVNQSNKLIGSLISDGKTKNSLRDSIAIFALKQIGLPYTAAGKSPKDGFDCSGFTQFVYKNFSITIPSSSITQSDFGDDIDLEQIQKADLLFFKSPTKGKENIGHVGIVISDLGEKIMFIHSSSNRGVVIDSLQNPHYKARFRKAKNILSARE